MKRPAIRPKEPPPCHRCYAAGVLVNGHWECKKHGRILPDVDPKGGSR